MSVHGYIGQPLAQPFRPTAQSSSAMNSYDHEPTNQPVGTPFGAAPPSCQVLIRRLPPNITEEALRLMLLFSQEGFEIAMLPPDPVDLGLRSAIVTFKSPAGAQQVREMLHGKSKRPEELELVVEMVPGSPTGSRRYPVDNTSTQNGSSSIASPGASSRQPTRFSDAFHPLDKISPPSNGFPHDPSNPEFYHSIFSPQSPIGNHITNQANSSGKNLIHDTAEDEETRELLKDPVAYAENGATQQRRATAPHVPIARIASLSLNTSTNGSSSIPPFTHPNMTPLSAHGNSMSPTVMNGANHSLNFPMGNFHRPSFPPVNPADQNPPCNTLYVGNLPQETSEEELKALFQKQRGYKRLCFRTKHNGPMCFVEFEDISHATRSLHELYGKLLSNSHKGGIRLSFSKNPLGVRSGQTAGSSANGSMASMGGMMAPSSNGYSIPNRPPPGLTTPGLSAPPGLNYADYNGANPLASSGTNTPLGYATNSHIWNNSQYNGYHSAAGSSSPLNGTTPAYTSPFTTGR
ncbi:hypothetical protein F4802DRAFT_597074 [Xylaria palmicola]|nr:hypothetical protein F4802DRAFT_597074 [Xylaria palmicola]